MLALDHRVLVDSYKADNGMFEFNTFMTHIRDHNNKLSCWELILAINRAAERALKAVSECACV